MMIQTSPPARPACFDSDPDWVSWLISAHLGGMRVVRRVDVGKSREARQTWHELLPTKAIDYCADCTARRQARMLAAGRCEPCEVEETADTGEDASWPER